VPKTSAGALAIPTEKKMQAVGLPEEVAVELDAQCGM
jgi:hypothetical protein